MIDTLITEPGDYSQKALKLYHDLGPVSFERDLTRIELLDQLEGMGILVIRLAIEIDSEVLDAATSLKAVVTPTTGLDHIDLEVCEEKGVAVVSLKGETDFLQGIPATSEHTWSLLLSLVRNIPWAFDAVREGRWTDNRLRQEFRGHDLAGRSLGVLGLGRVGRKVAKYGNTFGMRVHAYDPDGDNWPTDVARVATLLELASMSDVLSIHVPLAPETRGLVDSLIFEALPPGAVLINTSRGAIVDETAMLSALEFGRLAGAATDVISDETGPDTQISHALFDYANRKSNLLITPHVAGATFESMHSTEEFVAQKCVEFVSARMSG